MFSICFFRKNVILEGEPFLRDKSLFALISINNIDITGIGKLEFTVRPSHMIKNMINFRKLRETIKLKLKLKFSRMTALYIYLIKNKEEI